MILVIGSAMSAVDNAQVPTSPFDCFAICRNGVTDRFGSDMGILGRGAELGMPQQKLDHADIGAPVREMGSLYLDQIGRLTELIGHRASAGAVV